MLNIFRSLQRNKELYELLEDYKFYSDSQYDTDKKMVIQVDDRRMEVVIRMYELCLLNQQNIGYAIVRDKDKGLCLLMDKYEKDGKAEVRPFEDGRVTTEAVYKKKKQTVQFILENEK